MPPPLQRQAGAHHHVSHHKVRLGQRVIFMYHISIKGVPGALDDVGGHAVPFILVAVAVNVWDHHHEVRIVQRNILICHLYI